MENYTNDTKVVSFVHHVVDFVYFFLLFVLLVVNYLQWVQYLKDKRISERWVKENKFEAAPFFHAQFRFVFTSLIHAPSSRVHAITHIPVGTPYLFIAQNVNQDDSLQIHSHTSVPCLYFFSHILSLIQVCLFA